MRYEILNSRLEDVRKLVNKISKKGGEVTYEEKDTFFKEFTLTDSLGKAYTVTEQVTEVNLEAVFKVEGFTPIAVIDHIASYDNNGNTGDNIVTVLTNYKVPETYYHDSGKCDHCNTLRKRNKTILIQKDNELRQVGLSCLKDYTGVDAHLFAFTSQYLRKIEEYQEGLSYSSADYVSVINYLASCLKAYKDNNKVYVKTFNSYGERNYNSTKEAGLNNYYGKENLVEYLTEALSIINYVQELEDDYENDYLTNLKTLTSCDYAKVNYTGLIASLVMFKENQKKFLDKKLRQDLKKLSEHMYKVGERVTTELYLTRIASYGTEYGDTHIYELTDTSGNVYIWKTSNIFSEGFYDVTGTVKSHDIFNEVKQTILTRCKLTKKEI